MEKKDEKKVVKQEIVEKDLEQADGGMWKPTTGCYSNRSIQSQCSLVIKL